MDELSSRRKNRSTLSMIKSDGSYPALPTARFELNYLGASPFWAMISISNLSRIC